MKANIKLEKTLALESRGFPRKYKTQATENKLVFIHQHGNLDNVLSGLDLISRGTVDHLYKNDLLIVKTVKKLTPGHVFLGVVGRKFIVNAYVEKYENGFAYISSMSSKTL